MNLFRPKTLNDFIGNEAIKNCTEIQLKAANLRNKPLGHILNQGPYGCGKTTLADIISSMMNSTLHSINAASLKTKKHLLELVCKIKYRDVVFIDEIHRLDISLEEFLYPIMEDFEFSLPRPSGGKSAFETIKVPPFTLIGATTDIGLISGPFMSRFKIHNYLEPYTVSDLAKITTMNAKKLDLNITSDAVLEIARRSRMTPRIANSRLDWINDYRIAHNITNISRSDVIAAMEMQRIDSDGLEYNDRKYLAVLKSMNFRPLGVKSISSMTGLSEDTITKYIEPYLIAIGKIEISKTGRMLRLTEAEMRAAEALSDFIDNADVEDDI